jgi:ribosomal protein S12 methylthiotransferase
MAEMGHLLEKGVREINLVAQDTSAYGRDRYDDYRLADLLADLCRIEGDFWIRCLYVYPSGITEALLHQLAMQPKVVPYLDIPLQHVSPRVLSAMGRPAQRSDTLELVKKLRRAVPGIALRTTMMVGFPGETAEEHQEMLEIVREAAFEWLGAFRFCPEEGTPAAKMRGKVPKKTARERYNALMEMQAEITAQFNSSRIGRRTRVLLEGFDDELHAWVGRSAAEAPEVDGNILVYPDPRLHSGAFVEVELLEACLYDVTGRAL